MRRFLGVLMLLLLAGAASAQQYIGPGHTTATCIDWDGDGYGVGPGCTGPDADDSDATVQTAAQGITKYGTFLAFIQHLGYSPTRIWYFDIANVTGSASDANTCRAVAASFNPATTPACLHYSGTAQPAGAGLGAYASGDMFVFRAGTYGEMGSIGAICSSGSPCTYLAYPGETVTVDEAGGSGSAIILAAGYSAPLCGGAAHCTLNYEDYASVQNAKYVTWDGFTVTNSATRGAYGINTYGGDHITVRNFHIHHLGDGVMWNDGMSNTVFERSVVRDSTSHCMYWSTYYGVQRNAVVRDNLIYSCGMPHFQFNGRSQGFTFSGNILYGDQGTGTSLVTLMKGGGTAPGYTSYLTNNVLFGACNTPLNVVNYSDQIASDEYQWPINNLIIENNTIVLPKYCSAGTNTNTSAAVVQFSTGGLDKACNAGSGGLQDYDGCDVTTGNVIRNNVIANEVISAGIEGPFIHVGTGSGTYPTSPRGYAPGDPSAPDGVSFATYGRRNPITEAAKLTIQNNYFYSPNFAGGNYLLATNCSYNNDNANCIFWGGATPLTGYAGLSWIGGSYNAAGLLSLNAANTGNVTSNANPLFVADPSVSTFNALNYNFGLQAGSPLINTATTVGALATDIMGVTRSVPPSIGAYEGSGGGAPYVTAVTIQPSPVTLNMTGTQLLTCAATWSTTPADNCPGASYYSSNPAIATVSGSTITGVTGGTTTVYAIYQGKRSNDVNVTVLGAVIGDKMHYRGKFPFKGVTIH